MGVCRASQDSYFFVALTTFIARERCKSRVQNSGTQPVPENLQMLPWKPWQGVRASGTQGRTALLKLLDMSEGEYKQYWISQVFCGEAQAQPLALPSNGMQQEAVAAFPGGIALMDAQDVKPGMKVTRVNGRLPGETGYPLH